jgi:ABC-2 type transport system permease protein
MIRAVLTIARRDILATVFTRGFLIWLLMPIIGLAVGLVASLFADDRPPQASGAVAVIDATAQLTPWLQRTIEAEGTRAIYAGLRERFRAIHVGRPLPAELAALPEDLSADRLVELGQPGALEAVRDRTELDLGRFGSSLPRRDAGPRLVFVPATGDVDTQTRRLLRSHRDGDAGRRFDAVLQIDGRAARLVIAPGRSPDVDRIAWLVNEARERRVIERGGLGTTLAQLAAERRPLEVVQPSGPAADAAPTKRRSHETIGRIVASVIFMLIGLLAGVLLSNMVEEKANKVIEVLVASVPIPAIFAGKLIAMLTISAIGVAVWAGIAGGALAWALTQVPAAAIPSPAVGWPALLTLAGLYLTTAYLIYGAIYLGIGSLCASIREVQSLSMPVTIIQTVVLVGVLGAVDDPDGAWGTIMSWFPLSSPYMMAARAASEPGLGQHAVAIGWQLLFAGLVIAWSARLFRFGVLNSGPPPSLFAWRRQKSSLS